jgi:hypothetical protein
MFNPSTFEAMVEAESKRTAPVRQHQDGPRQKESDLLMPSRDPMGARLALALGLCRRIRLVDVVARGEAN